MSLSVENLTFSYGAHEVLRSISFQVERGEFLSVLGPNGTGKSTLFRCILGSLTEYGGQVLVNGEEMRTLSHRERAKRIAYIPQNHRPTFGYTVLDTALMGTTRQVSALSSPKQKQIDAAMDALQQVGVAHLADRNFTQLSGGEQQLVLIARALAQQSEILIMDEPTSALDYGNQLRILRQIRALSRQGYSVLLSTHNPQHALTFADRILALHNGAVAAHGKAESVLTPRLMKTLYGIDVTFVNTAGGSVIVPLTEGGGADVPME